MMTTAKPLPTALPGICALTLKEEMKRVSTTCNVRSERPFCQQTVRIGIFFDGTNNNKKRDQLDQPDQMKKCHTNIVVLHDAFRDDPANGYFKFYVPGVGTPFPEIGEDDESDEGRAFGKGGDARINWALLQVVNAIHRTTYSRPLLKANEVRTAVTTWPLHEANGLDANLKGKRWYFTEGRLENEQERRPAVTPLLPQLRRALDLKPLPRVDLVNVSVFGFSRGAAQARAFCTILHSLMEDDDLGMKMLLSHARLVNSFAGVPLRIQFLGLFDTVASVGFADPSPLWRGLGGWANSTLDIPPSVERTVHFVAAHEIRRAFPVSSVRSGDSFPANCTEVVYPGAHSDVGGGYAPGSQGKAVSGRSELLSQVPLVHMYMEAIKWGVPLRNMDDLEKSDTTRAVAADLQIHPTTARLFASYAEWAAPNAKPTQEMLHEHVRHYWRWRRNWQGRIAELRSFRNLPRQNDRDPVETDQDARDLVESDEDFRDDAKRVRLAAVARTMSDYYQGDQTITDPAWLDFLADDKRPATVPDDVDTFFDLLVHDSHATFYMCGPTTDYVRQQLLKNLRVKQTMGRPLTRLEQHILALNPVRTEVHPNGPEPQVLFPVLTDADTGELIGFAPFFARAGLHLMGQRQRREADGHVRYRRVFDKS
jgi:hypothetical protein